MSSDLQTPEADFLAFARARTGLLYRAAWLLCGDHHAAEDLVQDTLAKLYDRMVRRRARVENPVGYAQTTLLRTYLSARRRRSAHERPMAAPDDRGTLDPDVALRVTVAAALATLEPLDRAVFVARHVHDQPVAEVARALAMTEGAVRARTLRARERLRVQLGAPLGDLLPEEC